MLGVRCDNEQCRVQELIRCADIDGDGTIGEAPPICVRCLSASFIGQSSLLTASPTVGLTCFLSGTDTQLRYTGADWEEFLAATCHLNRQASPLHAAGDHISMGCCSSSCKSSHCCP